MSLPTVMNAAGSSSTSGSAVISFIRHAESTANAEQRLVGRLDAALSVRGLAQAEAAADFFNPVAKLLSSPLMRTRQTAAALVPGQKPEIEAAVIELDYGVLDGLKLNDVPRDIWARWSSDADFAPEGGESLNELQLRVGRWLDEQFDDPQGLARSADQRMLVVSHVSPIKAAVAWALRSDPLTSFRLRLDHLTETSFIWGPQGPVLKCFNAPLSVKELGN